MSTYKLNKTRTANVISCSVDLCYINDVSCLGSKSIGYDLDVDSSFDVDDMDGRDSKSTPVPHELNVLDPLATRKRPVNAMYHGTSVPDSRSNKNHNQILEVWTQT